MSDMSTSVPVWELLGGKVRDKCRYVALPSLLYQAEPTGRVYGWIGGDKPSDVLNAAKERKKQGFTALKMNAVESVCLFYTVFITWLTPFAVGLA